MFRPVIMEEPFLCSCRIYSWLDFSLDIGNNAVGDFGAGGIFDTEHSEDLL